MSWSCETQSHPLPFSRQKGLEKSIALAQLLHVCWPLISCQFFPFIPFHSTQPKESFNQSFLFIHTTPRTFN
jgi:hypothetical protein